VNGFSPAPGSFVCFDFDELTYEAFENPNTGQTGFVGLVPMSVSNQEDILVFMARYQDGCIFAANKVTQRLFEIDQVLAEQTGLIAGDNLVTFPEHQLCATPPPVGS
ncbi:MAG: hypothetical protein HKN32_08855, partial [Flavobacteriales bacterium]|nr:hypothetical protein [Flavobacteriales bacterium]